MISAVDAASATPEQRAAIGAPPADNVYVGAGPGTGKTYLLVERYRFLHASGVAPGAILVLTFSRRAAGELSERLTQAGFSGAVGAEVRTFHGFAARALGGGTAAFRTTRLLDGASRRIVLDAAIERTPTPALSPAIRASRTFRADLKTLLADLGRNGRRPEGLLAAGASPRLRDVLAIAAAVTAARETIGGSDLGDLVARAVAQAAQPGSPTAAWLAGRYTHVLVDEFQDIDRVELELLAALGAAIFAVGDEAQSIYRFRGAGNDIVNAACRRFSMRRLTLTQSRRCPPDVCALAARTPIPQLEPLVPLQRDGAAVEVVRLRALDDEVFAVADAIETELDAGRAPDQIAVLLRSFDPLGPLLAGELRRRSIAATSIGRAELLADPRVGTLRAALEVLARPADTARWERLLTARPLRYDPVAIRFARTQLAEFTAAGGPGPELAGICSGGVLTAAELATTIRFAGEAWTAGDLGMAARRIVRGLRLVAAVLHDESPAGVRAAAARLKLVCDALAGAQRTAAGIGAAARCGDIVARLDELLPELALDVAGPDPTAPGVRILTVHAAKGLEFERVFICDAVAGRFPREARPATLLDDADRRRLAAGGFDGPSVVDDADALEEAALWYVAVTRAKMRLTITFADAALNGDPQRPSRFLPAERLPAVRSVDREALSLRALRSGDAGLRRRVLTLDVLDDAPPAADYGRDPAGAFAALPGHPVRARRTLGVGDAELWLQCPRRFYYKQLVRLPGDRKAALPLGSAIHAILAAFHRVHTSFTPGSVDVAGWTDALLALRRAAWDPSGFETPVFARAAEISADFALRSYARALGEHARAAAFTVEACERDVTVSLPNPVAASGAVLTGRIDRIDRRSDGSRTVVDYKLGRAREKANQKLAAEIVNEWAADDVSGRRREPLARRLSYELRLQLGFYAAALDNVAEIAYVYLGGNAKAYKRNVAETMREAFSGAYRAVVAAALAEIESDLLAPLANGTLRTFPVTIDEKTCTHCPYVAVCPGAPDTRA